MDNKREMVPEGTGNDTEISIFPLEQISPIGHKPTPTAIPRRHARYAVQLDAECKILIPEATFQPHLLPGQTVNLSDLGMKIIISDIGKALFRDMLGGKRYIRVAFKEPFGNKEVKITGKIVWMDYFNPSKQQDELGPCVVGLDFSEGKDAHNKDYLEFIEHLKSKGHKQDD